MTGQKRDLIEAKSIGTEETPELLDLAALVIRTFSVHCIPSSLTLLYSMDVSGVHDFHPETLDEGSLLHPAKYSPFSALVKKASCWMQKNQVLHVFIYVPSCTLYWQHSWHLLAIDPLLGTPWHWSLFILRKLPKWLPLSWNDLCPSEILPMTQWHLVFPLQSLRVTNMQTLDTKHRKKSGKSLRGHVATFSWSLHQWNGPGGWQGISLAWLSFVLK